MISVILIEPQEPGNIGAVARAMANFELKELVLIDPKSNHLSEDSKRRAVHAQDVLKKAKVVNKSYLKKYDYLIATTSLMGTDYNIPRSPVLPQDFAQKISKKSKVGLVFGRESSGLTNKEIDMCDFVLTIPSSKKYPALNISHACVIVFYEIYKVVGKNKITDHVKMASGKDKEVVIENLNKILDTLEFSTKEKKQTQKTVWKRIFSKAMLTKREAFAVIGLLKKILKK